MALVACRECGHNCSTEAANCPNCGVGNPSWTRAGQKAAQQHKAGAGTVATGVFGGILGWVVAPFVAGFILLVLLGMCVAAVGS